MVGVSVRKTKLLSSPLLVIVLLRLLLPTCTCISPTIVVGQTTAELTVLQVLDLLESSLLILMSCQLSLLEFSFGLAISHWQSRCLFYEDWGRRQDRDVVDMNRLELNLGLLLNGRWPWLHHHGLVEHLCLLHTLIRMLHEAIRGSLLLESSCKHLTLVKACLGVHRVEWMLMRLDKLRLIKGSACLIPSVNHL